MKKIILSVLLGMILCGSSFAANGNGVALQDKDGNAITSANPLQVKCISGCGGGSTGANPTASVGTAAVNGVAVTFLRSDGAPALSQSISPTWTGNHIFSPSSGNTVFTAGNVGIGSATPGVLLDVAGTVRLTNLTYGATAFTGTTGTGTIVGSTSPTITTPIIGSIKGGTAAASNLLLCPTSSSVPTTPNIVFNGGNNCGTEYARFNINGNLGIGTANPGQTLDVAGTVRISQQIFVTGISTDATKTDATVCEDTTNHQFYSGSGTIGICLGTSTKQAKQNIVPIREGMPQIMALKPVSFNYKPGWGYDTKKSYYGFLAEDVSPVLPRLVGYNEKGETRNADYVGMIPVLVKAIQQMQAEVDSLKHKNEH